MRLSLHEIRNALGVPEPQRMGQSDAIATGYSIDSRTLRDGDLFFAIHGEHFDGHTFVTEALQKGAVAAVIWGERLPQFPGIEVSRLIAVESTLDALQRLARFVRERWHGRVIGVTGSVGKTTTKEAIAKVLSSRWQVLKSHGNLNNGYGMPLQLLKVQPEDTMAVLEMGMSSAGEIAALAAIGQPDWGVVTIAAPVHTEFFPDGIEGVARAKRELVEALPSDGVAFLNADDARVAAFRGHTAARVVTFGWQQSADIEALGIRELGMEGTTFTLRSRGESAECRLRLVGVHNVTNALAAAAVGIEAGLSVGECAEALGEMEPQDGRGQALRIGGAYLINDCYNSNPLALDAMVNTLVAMPADRHIVVAGEMLELGAEAEAMHTACGRHMAEEAVAVVLGVRGYARAIVDAAARCGTEAHFFETPEAAGDWLNEHMRSGDAVLLKASRGVKLERALERLVVLRKVVAGSK